MFHTPPSSKMVSTRSAAKRERSEMESKDVQPQLLQGSSEPTYGNKPQDKICPTVTIAGSSAVKMEDQPPRHASVKSSRCKRSTSSSVLARRKQLELEAAREKARIQMELIDKKLEVDLAELEDEKYSSHQEERTCTDVEVEKWLERSEQELEQAQTAPDLGMTSGCPCRPVDKNSGTEGTIQMLATALKDLAAASAVQSGPNTSLLTRISTPKDLPVFSGDPMEWLEFKQAYEESTQVCKFSPKENLWRLRKCLGGPAKDAVTSLLITASHPDKIISTLALRFGNPDIIINKIMDDIKRMQSMSPEYHKEIVSFSVKVQNFVAAVQAVGREEYLQGMNLVSTILVKLPPVLISKWSDYSFPLISKGKKSRMEILADFLHEEAVKISTTANISNVRTHSDHHYKSRNPEIYGKRQQTVLVNAQQSDKCSYCRVSKHKLTACKQFNKALRKDRWRHVKRYGLCFKCLLSRHERETCSAAACDMDGCGRPHHRLLHYPVNQVANDTPEAVTTCPNETVTHINVSNRTVLLKVLPIKIHGPNGIIDATALLDDGSTVSLINNRLAERAGLRGRRESMRVCGAWNNTEIVCDATVLDLDISGVDNKVYSIRARSVNNLNLPVQDLSTVDLNMYPNLQILKDNLCTTTMKPDVLLGQDNYHLLLPLETSVGKLNEPSATRTPLGWCVHGCARVGMSRRANSSHSTLLTCYDVTHDHSEYSLRDLHDVVRRSFSIESMGVSGLPRQNVNDVRAQAVLERTTVLIDGRWHVGLPWKDENCAMPDSYPNALSRLKGVERKMSVNKGYAYRYTERVSHLFENNFAEEIKVKGTQLSPRTWYLPHFGVDNPNKKKLRLVFDAAAKTNGLCLNDYLHKGPDLLASLLGIMMRFRENKFAVTGDIKDMFLRVKIREEDQSAFQFIWRNNPSEPVQTYKMTSLIFGANCSPFIAQFVKNKNAQRFESTMPDAVQAIYKQHYMDDYIDSFSDEDSAILMVKNIADIHKAGGFEIRNWTSNSIPVLDSVPKETLGTGAVRFKVDQQFEGERTLGLLWYPSEDTLGFDVSMKRIPEEIITGKQKPTKRIFLRVIMSIFDVFGFLAPFTIQGKIMLQDIWRAGIEWDDVIPDNVFSKWQKWLALLQVIKNIRIPRWYQAPAAESIMHNKRDIAGTVIRPEYYEIATASTTRCATRNYDKTRQSINSSVKVNNATKLKNYRNLELHVFSDASTKAMCAVAYWRWTDDSNMIRVAFIASKCRVAPVNFTTVPRLELQAALLACRLAEAILREHRIDVKRRYFWCDSTTVLHWIGNDARNYKTFVANRLGEIDELTRVEEWRYIPTKLNVADCATREVYDTSVFENDWFKGPAFLYSDESSWPKHILNPVNLSDLECVTVVHSLQGFDLPIPDPSRFSSWLRLVRATAAVLRFINRCRKIDETDLSLNERAERLLLKQAQKDSFPCEVVAIENSKYLDKNSRLLTLSPVLDDRGLLRVGGRINAATGVTTEIKSPVILDGKHHVSRLIVRHHHVKAAHGNQETVVNDLKQKYWIINLRPTVKYVASRCMLCRIKKAKPEVPRMGDLPVARVAHHQRPFTHCGVDLFGPMEVAIGKRREKRYGVLFTCLTVRAIHLEIVPSLTSDSLIMALRRMAARRGWPQYLYSDNGTNLRGADTELKKSIQELDDEVLRNEAVNNGAQWTFIPPMSPHWAGAWERLIRSVKTSLKVVLKERAPREEILSTLFAEVENIVNSRPLSHVSVEPGSEESLTPNHFLLGTSAILPTLGEFDHSDLNLRKQWRKAQLLADMFWKRWVREVLPDLLPRKKWTQEQKPLQVGELVLIVDPDSPRNVWPRGIIQNVFPGRDGRVRLVELKTKSGTLRRSAARVARIPIAHEC